MSKLEGRIYGLNDKAFFGFEVLQMEHARLMLPDHTPGPWKFFVLPNSLIYCNPINPCGIELYVEFTNEVENPYGVVRSKMPLR